MKTVNITKEVRKEVWRHSLNATMNVEAHGAQEREEAQGLYEKIIDALEELAHYDPEHLHSLLYGPCSVSIEKFAKDRGITKDEGA